MIESIARTTRGVNMRIPGLLLTGVITLPKNVMKTMRNVYTDVINAPASPAAQSQVLPD
jgi:hypothetical protein